MWESLANNFEGADLKVSMATKGTVRTVFYMDEDDREALVRMSDESGLSPAELTRRAVKMFLRPRQGRVEISHETYRALMDLAKMLKSEARSYGR